MQTLHVWLQSGIRAVVVASIVLFSGWNAVDAKSISLQDKAAVDFTVDFQDSAKLLNIDAGDTAFSVPAKHGSVLRIIDAPGGITYSLTIKNINVNKYDISLTTEQQEEEKNKESDGKDDSSGKNGQDIFGIGSAKDVIGKVVGAGTSVGLQGATESSFPDLLVALTSLKTLLSGMDAFVTFNKQIEKARDTAETYASFSNAIDAAFQTYKNDTTCSTVGAYGNLGAAISAIKKCVNDNTTSVRKAVKEARSINTTSMHPSERAVYEAVTPYLKETDESARKLADSLDATIDRIKGYLDPTVAQDSLFTYHSAEVNCSDGAFETVLTVRHKPAGKSKQGRMAYRLRFLYDSRVEKKTFVEFSQGLLVSFEKDNSYTTSDGVIVRKGAEDNFNPAISAMVHVGRMVGESVGLGLGLGIGADDSDPKYFFGPGVTFPKSRRMFISIGVAMVKVERLDGYNLGNAFSEATVPTKKVWRETLFVGATFNF